MKRLRLKNPLEIRRSQCIWALSLFLLISLTILTGLWNSKRQNDDFQTVGWGGNGRSTLRPTSEFSSLRIGSSVRNKRKGDSRLVFPFSVVDGGVQTPGELRTAIERDSVVAAHYSNFDSQSARVVQSPAKKAVYVSYRVKNQVYWTRKKVSLAKGEMLITDGKSYIRSRCGNQISETPRAPLSADEPSEAMLNRPVPAVESLPAESSVMPVPTKGSPETGLFSSNQLSQGSRRVYPFVIPGLLGGGYVAGRSFGDGTSGNVPSTFVAPPPIVKAPEPSSLALLVTGIAALLAYGRIRRRH
jgi:hypothetical protein